MGLGELLAQLLGETRALVSDYAELAVLDARRAAIRLAWLLGTGPVVAVLVVTAWLALVAAGIVWMMGEGMSWIASLAIAALLNLVAAGALAWWGKHLATEMPFTELLRQLRGQPPQEP
jgi:Putative Actinobacterial Holin-X, holin superfamily III